MSKINHFEDLVISEVYKSSPLIEKMSMLKDLKHESYYSGADANYEFYKLFDDLKVIFERGDEIKNNWENNCYQEATHYNWLDDQLHEKDQLIFNLQDRLSEAEKVIELIAGPVEFYCEIGDRNKQAAAQAYQTKWREKV